MEQYGPAYPLSRIREFFAADDLTCANLDCVLAGNRNGEDYSRNNRLRGLPEYADIFDFSLGTDEMQQINALDRQQRLIEFESQPVAPVEEWFAIPQ